MSFLRLLTVLYVVGGVTATITYTHHNTTELIDYLVKINSTYPDITHLYSIGQSVKGTELWVLAIGKDIQKYVELRPSVKYVANMHGNEVVGRELLLHLIDLYVISYWYNNTIREFLDTTAVHIMPTMNPDGYDNSSMGDCDGLVGRPNADGSDLNRNFPELLHNTQHDPIRKETQAIMDWLPKYNFVLSANMHGGALVVTYPYDQYVDANQKTGPATCPDDDVFKFLALTYTKTHESMSVNNGTTDGSENGDICKKYKFYFDNDISNGADWYPVSGGMQDYNYIKHGILEVTMELSCCKYPNTSQLAFFWNQNKNALLQYLMSVHMGVKGFILDENNNTIQGAKLTVKGREAAGFHSTKHGEYYRLLLPGNYTIMVEKTGYDNTASHITVSKGVVTRYDITMATATSAAMSLGAHNYLTLMVVSLYELFYR